MKMLDFFLKLVREKGTFVIAHVIWSWFFKFVLFLVVSMVGVQNFLTLQEFFISSKSLDARSLFLNPLLRRLFLDHDIIFYF